MRKMLLHVAVQDDDGDDEYDESCTATADCDTGYVSHSQSFDLMYLLQH